MAKYRITPSSKAIIQLPISIGHKAEKGVEAIEFDVTAWVEAYGSGTLTVIMRRWGDAIPYPIALEIDENNKATWTLSDIDTAKAGMAYAQLSYVVGDEVVKKSDIYTFRVMDSLTGEGDPPEAYESWLEQLTHLAAEAMAEVLDIEGIVTDKTLTVDGGIADAKATGDALSALEDQFTEETDKLKADLDAQTGIISFKKNSYIDTSTTPISLTPKYSSIGRMCAVVDCAPGDKFVINAYSDFEQARTWCFIDSANNAISMAEAQADVTDLELTAPTNAVKLIINDKSGGMSYKVGNNLATKLGNGLSDDIKSALLACFDHVAWSGTGGQSYYDALESALYPESWDYEWSSDSGELPEHMTATEYDFTTEPGALFATTPILDFSYTGDCKLQITMKTGYVSANNNPQILIQNAVISQNQYRGIKMILNTNLSTSSEHSMCAVSVNGANALIPGSNCNEYHTYELTANNNVYEVSIDGEPVEITQNTDVSAYFARTGMSCAEGYGGFIKSIKFKRL